MKLLTVDTIGEAREKINNCIKKWPVKTESVALAEAQNRVLAEDIFSPCDIPPFRRSTVDGYAVIAADTSGAGETIPVYLKQTGYVQMGKPADFSIRGGECAYVPTGGMLPDGADAVVMVEYCEPASGIVAMYEAAAAGSGTAETGEDLQKGRLFLKRGTVLRPQEIGALSAAGITIAPVLVPFTVSIISTGDELTAPENDPAYGMIRDVNTNMLKALAERYGYRVTSAQVLGDDEKQLEAAVREVMNISDIVVISGGSSQGEKDFTAQIIDCAAKPGVFTHGLAVKPGKPTILGWDEESKTLFAGLPGHPVSALIVFELLFGSLSVNPRFSASRVPPIPARISCNVPGAPGRTVCQPVVLRFKDGSYSAEPVFGKSGMISTLTQADGYIIIDLNKEWLNKDDPVFVNLF